MIQIIEKKDFVESTWSGGKTIQIAIGPENSVYANRDFLWRVSSATVDLAESDYTALPDYDRFITPITGEMKLTHDGGEEISLDLLEVHEFDGASATHCKGICTDFNLMLRKEKTAGSMDILDLDGEAGILLNPVDKTQKVLIYVLDGLVYVGDEDRDIACTEGNAIFVTDENVELLIDSEDGATAIICCIEEL